MRWKAILITTILLATLGLVGANAQTNNAPIQMLERIDREEMTPSEWHTALLEKHGKFDLKDAEVATFELGPNEAVAAGFVDGKWGIDVIPRPIQASSSGIEPAHDCLNDHVDYWYASWYPLTANLLYPAAPNVASAGMCNGSQGLWGPVNYVTFWATGDAGGWLEMWDYAVEGWYLIGCHPLYWGGESTGAFVSFGVESTWRTTNEHQNVVCYVYSYGPQPSEWFYPETTLVNWNYYYGEVYGSYVTGGIS